MSAPEPNSIEKQREERVSDAPRRPAMFVVFTSVAVVFFLLGSAVSEFRCFPYSMWLQPAFTAARAVHRQIATSSSLRETDLWHAPRFEQRGVTRYIPDKCFDGLTLYTSGHDCAAFLVDMNGQLQHSWRLPFHTLWDNPPHVERAVPPAFVHWRRAHLFPNGDLIAMYEAAGDTPWGYGLVKVDRQSNVIWSLADHIHHDLVVRPDGSVITLAHDWRNGDATPVSGTEHLGRVLLDDYVLVVSADGEVTQRVSLLDAITGSDYADLLTTVTEEEWDLLHTNTVELITPEFAAHHDFAKAGQVMVSLRSRNALAILDLQSEQIVWASCGPYRAQHDPDVLPNGNVLLFDNHGNAGPGGPSRILELDPASQAIRWSYAGSESEPLFSLVRSTQQLLPNDNVLITESDAGRILEVSRSGEICWEFRNPATLPDDGAPSIAIVCGAIRLPADYVQFPLDGVPNSALVSRGP